MTLNHKHILGLLSDILKNQNSIQHLSLDEQTQIKELACQLLDIGITDSQLCNVLNSIQELKVNNHSYCTEEELAEWLSVIDQNILT